MHPNKLTQIYNQLSSRYPLTLTTTSALNEGFTIDAPILCGKAHDLTFWLYEEEFIEFVFSYEVPGKNYHDHTHPQNVEEAIELIEEFHNHPENFK